MAAPVDDSRIISPFMPSLFHIALMKTAQQLFTSFGTSVLYKIYDYQHEDDKSGEESEVCVNDTFNRAKSSFLLIPPCLRKKIMEAVDATKNAALVWKYHYLLEEDYKEKKFHLLWRSDGTVDEVKTAQNIISNEGIDIKKRFHIACEYCVEEGIKSLWPKIENSGLSDTFKSSVPRFWIVRMQKKEVQNHWTVDLLEYLRGHADVSNIRLPRLSTFLHLLQPDNRKNCFIFLPYVDADDLRHCLLTLSKEEEEAVKQKLCHRILNLFLMWPLQGFYLNVVEKLWKFIDFKSFQGILADLFLSARHKKDFDYPELLELFLNRSPDHLKRPRFQSHFWVDRINCFLDEKRKKRKSDVNEQAPCKRR